MSYMQELEGRLERLLSGIPEKEIIIREVKAIALESYRNGQKAVMETANGDVLAYRVKLDTVCVGDVTVNNVDAVVTEGNGLPVALLGMSFLNRVDIKREGAIMTLTKRY